MGSGSSAKKKYGVIEDEEEPEPASSEPSIRVCDCCGETRRTACLEDGKWFCVACQLSSGAKPAPVKPRTAELDAAMLVKPQPQLVRGATFAHQAIDRDPAIKFGRSMSFMPEDPLTSTAAAPPGTVHAPEGSPRGEGGEDKAKRRRRKAKHAASAPSPAKANATPSYRHEPGEQLNLHLERDDYKSAKGLRELKKELKAEKGETRRDSDQELETVEQAQSQQVSLPAPKRMPLPGGFHTGDRVASLVSRKRFGTVVLESGHEGIIASLALGMYSGGDDDVRLLVQFQAGHDWRLPLRQLCAASDYNAVKASPLPGGHSWGARVRSLVTYLNPPGGKKEVWLGDCGTVLGPGQTKSKIAVRFDDGRGEWNIWPSTLCSADGFNDAVKQRLAGGFGRGDRVTSKGNNQGSRSAEKGAGTLNKPQLQDGEEGTVVGPGHAAGWVLVHFDSDERVWSLKPTQLRAQASCI